MTVIQDIDRLEKQAGAAIKLLEEERRNIKAIGGDVLKRHNAISATVKSIVGELHDASEALASWERTYDSTIFSLQMQTKEYADWKKKSAEVQNFYNELTKDKKKRDDDRKKAGKNYKPTKQDKIFDAVYKRASKAYEASNFPHSVETMADMISGLTNSFRDGYESRIKELDTAMNRVRYHDISFRGSQVRPGKPMHDKRKRDVATVHCTV